MHWTTSDGWVTINTIIRFRLGHNLSIDAIFEDTNLSYILDNCELDLTHDKKQSTDTAIAVWLGRQSPNNQH